MNVAKRITFFREKKQLTVNALANLAGISQSFLRDVELDKKQPTVETLIHICNALNITLHDLLDDKTQTALLENELLQQVYLLTPEQQKLFKDLLKSF